METQVQKVVSVLLDGRQMTTKKAERITGCRSGSTVVDGAVKFIENKMGFKVNKWWRHVRGTNKKVKFYQMEIN